MLLPALEADLVLDGCGRHCSGAMIARHYNPANTSCACRLDDRIGWATSAFGTFRTCGNSLTMSASGGAGSTGRRNTGVKSLRRGFKLQCLTWSFV